MFVTIVAGIYWIGHLMTQNYELDLSIFEKGYKPKRLRWIFWPFTIVQVYIKWRRAMSKFK